MRDVHLQVKTRRVIVRDECQRCGSDTDSMLVPGKCADERCRGEMVVVEYLPADLLLGSAAVTAAHDLMKGRGIRAGRTNVADMLAAAFRAAHPRPSLSERVEEMRGLAGSVAARNERISSLRIDSETADQLREEGT